MRCHLRIVVVQNADVTNEGIDIASIDRSIVDTADGELRGVCEGVFD